MSMILMNDFNSEPERLKQDVRAAVDRVLNSGWFILGKELERFESEWASTCGARHAIGVANGMDAIEIIVRSIGIGPGDEVITTPMTAFATVLAIYRAGATPVLADIDETTALLSIESAQRCITKKTKAVLLVHLYGQVRDMDEWLVFCEDHGLYLIEDCAQSHMASWNGRMSGRFGVAGAYSFYPTKNLGAYGDAGAIITDDDLLMQKSRRLRNYGQSIRYHHPDVGLNSRLDELQAAILTERLSWLGSFTVNRQSIAQRYLNEIKNPKIQHLAPPKQRDSHCYHLFIILTQKRKELSKHLQDQNIQTLIHYPIPIHHQDSCHSIKRDPKGLGNSEHHALTCLSLPCHPQMKDHEILTVINAVNSFN